MISSTFVFVRKYEGNLSGQTTGQTETLTVGVIKKWIELTYNILVSGGYSETDIMVSPKLSKLVLRGIKASNSITKT